MTKAKKERSKRLESPIEQPGGEVLADMLHVLHRQVRGEIYSDEAFGQLGEIIITSEYFNGIIESGGWKRE